MHSPLIALLWKEWHEQRWKLVFGCVMLMAYVAIGLRARLLQDVATVVTALYPGALILAIFTAMGVTATERSERTFDVLLSRPISPWKTLAVKTLVAIAVSATPLVAAALLAIVMAGGREIASSQMLLFLPVALTMNVSMLLWTLSFGIGRPSEAQVALVGIGVIALGLAAILLDGVFAGLYGSWLCWLHPLTVLGAVGRNGGVPGTAIAVELSVAGLVWVLAAARIGRPRRAAK